MLEYILLGILQGITEFLPVSSSGHLVILQSIFGATGKELAISLVLHLGTSLSLCVFFFKDIIRLLSNLKWVVLIMIVTVITGFIGILGKDFFERVFSQPKFVGFSLIFTGLILLLSRKFMNAQKREVTGKDALILGLAQGVAIIPGISRSGMTMTALLFRNIDRDTAFRFSFLASIPVIIGAVFLEAKEVGCIYKEAPLNLISGFLVSFFVGIVSLKLLQIVLSKAKLYYFGYYCFLIGLIALSLR